MTDANPNTRNDQVVDDDGEEMIHFVTALLWQHDEQKRIATALERLCAIASTLDAKLAIIAERSHPPVNGGFSPLAESRLAIAKTTVLEVALRALKNLEEAERS